MPGHKLKDFTEGRSLSRVLIFKADTLLQIHCIFTHNMDVSHLGFTIFFKPADLNVHTMLAPSVCLRSYLRMASFAYTYCAIPLHLRPLFIGSPH